MNRIVPTAALETAITGLILIASPYLFTWLVLGSGPSDLGRVFGRIAGIAMIGGGSLAGHAYDGERSLIRYSSAANLQSMVGSWVFSCGRQFSSTQSC